MESSCCTMWKLSGAIFNLPRLARLASNRMHGDYIELHGSIYLKL